jgi:hypothetical protein
VYPQLPLARSEADAKVSIRDAARIANPPKPSTAQATSPGQILPQSQQNPEGSVPQQAPPAGTVSPQQAQPEQAPPVQGTGPGGTP